MEQLGELRTTWDRFEITMESHQLMIKDQVGGASDEVTRPGGWGSR